MFERFMGERRSGDADTNTIHVSGVRIDHLTINVGHSAPVNKTLTDAEIDEMIRGPRPKDAQH